MSALFTRFKTDKKSEEDGAWIVIVDDVEFCIRRFNSKAVQEVRKRLEKPYRDMIQRGTLPDAKAEELLNKQLIQGVIVDWRNVKDEDGNILQFNEKNAETLFNALPDLKTEVLQISMSREAFRDKTIEDAAGNFEAA